MKISRFTVLESSAEMASGVASESSARCSSFGDSVGIGTGATSSSINTGGGKKTNAQLGSEPCTRRYMPETERPDMAGVERTGGSRSGEAAGLNVVEGYKESKYASIPATCGDAMDVPDIVIVAVLLSLYVDLMFKPERTISTCGSSR